MKRLALLTVLTLAVAGCQADVPGAVLSVLGFQSASACGDGSLPAGHGRLELAILDLDGKPIRDGVRVRLVPVPMIVSSTVPVPVRDGPVPGDAVALTPSLPPRPSASPDDATDPHVASTRPSATPTFDGTVPVTRGATARYRLLCGGENPYEATTAAGVATFAVPGGAYTLEVAGLRGYQPEVVVAMAGRSRRLDVRAPGDG